MFIMTSHIQSTMILLPTKSKTCISVTLHWADQRVETLDVTTTRLLLLATMLAVGLNVQMLRGSRTALDPQTIVTRRTIDGHYRCGIRAAIMVTLNEGFWRASAGSASATFFGSKYQSWRGAEKSSDARSLGHSLWRAFCLDPEHASA